MSRLVAALLIGGTIAWSALAEAQMPVEIRSRIEAIGTGTGPEAIESTREIYTPLAKAAPKSGVTVRKNVSYGADPLQVLDVYQPQGRLNAPVVVFVHGGGFVRGDKDPNDEIYSNVLVWFARRGIFGINANYRLAPAAPWPAGAEDVAGIVGWIRINGKQMGIDDSRIFLMGHSAGATHVASYVFDKTQQPADGSGVAGAILLSGVYRVTAGAPPEAKAYFGNDAAQYSARSPLTQAPQSKTPLFIVTAEYDPLPLSLPSVELLQAVCVRDGRCPRFLRMVGHNHFSTAMHFNTGDEQLGKDILEFMRLLR